MEGMESQWECGRCSESEWVGAIGSVECGSEWEGIGSH